MAINRVKEYREKKAWSKAKLARLAGVVSQTIAKMESGVPTTRVSQLKVALALDEKHADVFPNSKDE